MKQAHLPFDTPQPPVYRDHPLVKILAEFPGTLEYITGLCGVRPEHQFAAAQALLRGEVTPELKRATDHYGRVKL